MNQYFNVGDKVARVENNPGDPGAPSSMKDTPLGVVLCVSETARFADGTQGVAFVDFPKMVLSHTEWWYSANDYRKVEEIQLCVRAAEKMKTSEEVEA